MAVSSSGGLTVTDAGGGVKFAASIQHYLETDYLRGSFTIPRRDLENNAINTTVEYTLGSCNAASTIVLGSAKIVRGDTFATGLLEIAPTNAWNALGGTLLLGAGRCSYANNNKVTGDGFQPAGFQTLTFFAAGGLVKAREVFIGHEVPSAAITSTTFVGTPQWIVSFKLSVGVFDR